MSKRRVNGKPLFLIELEEKALKEKQERQRKLKEIEFEHATRASPVSTPVVEEESKQQRDARYLLAIKKMRYFMRSNGLDLVGKKTNALIRDYALLKGLTIPENSNLKEWLARHFNIPVKTTPVAPLETTELFANRKRTKWKNPTMRMLQKELASTSNHEKRAVIKKKINSVRTYCKARHDTTTFYPNRSQNDE